jgi:hypothetical protein
MGQDMGLAGERDDNIRMPEHLTHDFERYPAGKQEGCCCVTEVMQPDAWQANTLERGIKPVVANAARMVSCWVFALPSRRSRQPDGRFSTAISDHNEWVVPYEWEDFSRRLVRSPDES